MKQLFDKHFNMGVINVPYCLQPVASVNLAQVQSEVYALASVFIPLTLFSLRHSVNRLIFFPRSSVGSHALDPFWTISPTSHFSLFLLFPLPPSKRKVVSKLYFFIPVSFLLLYRCKSSFLLSCSKLSWSHSAHTNKYQRAWNFHVICVFVLGLFYVCVFVL